MPRLCSPRRATRIPGRCCRRSRCQGRGRGASASSWPERYRARSSPHPAAISTPAVRSRSNAAGWSGRCSPPTGRDTPPHAIAGPSCQRPMWPPRSRMARRHSTGWSRRSARRRMGRVMALLSGAAHAQTTLRIGLAEDPDILDPTLARTYVGRIVFSSLCDKLFDIDEKLNVVPQLALSHETSADGKAVTIKLRPGVKFHDGEPLDAEAAKFSLERHLTFPGSFRKSELASVDHVEIVDPLTIKLVLKTPYAPLIAQLTDRAGMMVSPKAARESGDKFG